MNRRPTPETDAELYPMNGVDIVWPDFARRLESERDELRSDLEFRRGLFQLQEQQLNDVRKERDELRAYADKLAAGLPEGMLPKDVEVLRDANLALAVALEELNSINAERAAHRGTRKAWIELDDKRQILEKQLTSERALADRLAEGLRKMVLYSEALILRIQDRSDINFKTLNECIDLFNEWKEARGE